MLLAEARKLTLPQPHPDGAPKFPLTRFGMALQIGSKHPRLSAEQIKSIPDNPEAFVRKLAAENPEILPAGMDIESVVAKCFPPNSE